MVRQKLCSVLTAFHLKQSAAVLVLSQLGISRSATIVMAYLMAENKWSLKASCLLTAVILYHIELETYQ